MTPRWIFPAVAAPVRGMVVSGMLVLGMLVLGGSVPARAETVQISMENLEISPGEVKARVGDTVEWINKDVLAHTATARNGDWDVMLPPKKSGTVVLKKAGTVEYYCRFHPNMKAVLIVAP
jgi:plastocyanin